MRERERVKMGLYVRFHKLKREGSSRREKGERKKKEKNKEAKA